VVEAVGIKFIFAGCDRDFRLGSGCFEHTLIEFNHAEATDRGRHNTAGGISAG
jgi:hypothetical protein